MSERKEKQRYKLQQQFKEKNQEKLNKEIADRFMETLETKRRVKKRKRTKRR
tara:strand:+ start:133 stop:288 length:156 start_codon:yes stop_codon:yes gene_type:complete